MFRFALSAPRALSTLCAISLVIGLAGGAVGSTHGASKPATLQQQPGDRAGSLRGSGSEHWFVDAGEGGLDDALSALDFYSHNITIDAGDSVTWTARGNGHTVSFLAPGQPPPPPSKWVFPAGGHSEDGSSYTSSGALEPGASYTLTFPKPGVFKYLCLFHQPEMTGQVVVQKRGAPYPHTQAYYYASVVPDIQFDLGQAAKSLAQFPFKDQTTLAAGIAPGLYAARPSQSTVLRFLDRFDNYNIRIEVGTTLTWVNESNNEPHTVTFPRAGQPLPHIPPGSPKSGGSSYDGTQLTNSGVILPGQRYSLKFTKAGTFRYGCLFHFPEGMLSTVTVVQ